MNEKKQRVIFLAAGIMLLCIAAILLHSFKGQFGQNTRRGASESGSQSAIEVSDSVPGRTEQPKQVTSTPSLPAKWVVYVTGAVKKPGVYDIPVDSRTYIALNAAGGFTDKADPEAVNLAAMLQDGVQIHFPAKNEKQRQASAPAAAVAAQVPSGSSAPAANTGKAGSDGSPVNINTATQAELETIAGVGPKTAQAIIAYREANGAFSRIEDLLLVKGIGPKKYDAVKGLITVGK